VEGRPVLGEAVDGLYPVHEERWNGVVRDRLNALTRKTHAFAKTVETWDVLVILCLFEHNGLRPHRALREAQEGLPEGRRDRPRTPAMAIGWTEHLYLNFRSYAVGAQLSHSHRHIWGVLADHSPYVGLSSCQLRKS
jgi:hypothetical protein